MLRWVLANGPAAIACEVDAMTDHAFALRVVPLAAPEDGFVELFCTATSALERHADITERLRDAVSTPVENLTVPPVENLTDRRGDEPQVVGTS